jgi:hypothetical protein
MGAELKEELPMRPASPLTGSAVAVAVLTCPQLAFAAGEGRIIELSDSGAIAQATAVNTAIDSAVEAAAACRKTTSRTALECECAGRTQMARLKSAYETAVADHPEWPKPDTTVWWSGTALNFSAIKRTLATCP